MCTLDNQINKKLASRSPLPLWPKLVSAWSCPAHQGVGAGAGAGEVEDERPRLGARLTLDERWPLTQDWHAYLIPLIRTMIQLE